MRVPVATTTKDVQPARTIPAGRRCDRCGAEAFAAALVKEVWLFFCGHHFNRHEEALYGIASDIVDERNHINARPSQSATV